MDKGTAVIFIVLFGGRKYISRMSSETKLLPIQFIRPWSLLVGSSPSPGWLTQYAAAPMAGLAALTAVTSLLSWAGTEAGDWASLARIASLAGQHRSLSGAAEHRTIDCCESYDISG